MSYNMDKKPIRNFYNQIIGYIETKPNGDQIVRNFYNQILGYYMKSDDTTRNFYKQILGKGNFVTQLLYDEYNKKK